MQHCADQNDHKMILLNKFIEFLENKEYESIEEKTHQEVREYLKGFINQEHHLIDLHETILQEGLTINQLKGLVNKFHKFGVNFDALPLMMPTPKHEQKTEFTELRFVR